MQVVELTSDNFEREALGCDVPVLIDFWATWCGPCMMMSPVIDEIAEEGDGTGYKICKVNVDEQPELAEMFEISVIPTLVIIRDSEESKRVSGVQKKERVLELLA